MKDKFHKLTCYLLVACLAAGVSIAIVGGDAVAGDAGPVAADAGPLAPEVTPELDPNDGIGTSTGFAEEISALRQLWLGGGWIALMGGIVSILVRYGRPWVSRRIEWFSSPVGGYVFTFLTAALTGIAEAMTLGTLSWRTAGAVILAAAVSLAATPGQDKRSGGAR